MDNMGLNTSDRKKMLALPFFCAKRQEKPSPKAGQAEWALFEKIYGKAWNTYEFLERDTEKKITEFDYEDFIHPELLKGVDTSTPEFKKKIRTINLNSSTAYEKHLENQEEFK